MPEQTQGPDEMVTVAEWAEAHCRVAHEVAVPIVQEHVAAVILAMIGRNRSPWNVGVDADGRVSLMWVNLPAWVWENLYAEGSQITVIGGRS